MNKKEAEIYVETWGIQKPWKVKKDGTSECICGEGLDNEGITSFQKIFQLCKMN